ncbi:sporulation protein YqfD [Thalassobacillus sp. B23F22_16]|uniref:sporulation protein YqfD n=1 Tax=Thalassobacillus sp. B23F22_16 TaxID=3459513 RepID=UPI00373E028C
MKPLQGKFIKGYVTLIIQGTYPEQFINLCAREGVVIWNAKKLSEHQLQANIYLDDLTEVKRIRKRTRYKIRLKRGQGIPYLWSNFVAQKPLWFALLLTIMLLVFVSNLVWSVHIEGLPKELEKKVEKQLKGYGVQPGAVSFRLDDNGTLQQKLLDDIPELLWIGVEKKGTAYIFHGVEKTLVEKEEARQPADLVAAKKGMIHYIYISQGKPMVEVNDYVEKGDLLASAQLDENDKSLVRAEGQVVAETWYRVEVTASQQENIQTATGEFEKQYHINIAGFEFPVWGWGKIDYKFKKKEEDYHQLSIFSKTFPFYWKKTTYFELSRMKYDRTEEEAAQIAKEQGKRDLLKKLPEGSEITEENILHRSVDNGKVKLILFMKVHEDIAKTKNVNQGD